MNPEKSSSRAVASSCRTGLALLVMGLLCNEWFLTALFSHKGWIMPSTRLMIRIAEMLLLVWGGATIAAELSPFKMISLGVSLFSGFLLLLASAEVYLKEPQLTWSGLPVELRQVMPAYRPFTVQYLHPFYYFFFPRDPHEIQRINNKVCSIDARGFRGTTPEEKGSRQLAFILGGSAVFGQGSSSNETTISGYLNKLQKTYHVVNAGVPSWNSTQEFYRMSMELLSYKPTLIIVYDGFNDAAVGFTYLSQQKNYPPGTPESYQDLEEHFDDIRGHKGFWSLPTNYGDPFPHLTAFINSDLQRPAETKKSVKNKQINLSDNYFGEANLAHIGQAYVENIDHMQHLAKSYHIRIVVIMQPYRHSKFKRGIADLTAREQWANYLDGFHYFAIQASQTADVSIVDFSNLFHELGMVPGQIFIDQVHLNDYGNEVVAENIVRLLKTKRIL